MAGGVVIGSALTGSQNWGIPEGFDTEGFLAAAKRNFVTLQSAWDRGDLSTLRSMMTDELLSEVRLQTRVDGSSTVGRDQDFGILVSIVHTEAMGRAARFGQV